METTIVYWGYIGIMEKKMETTIVYWGYIGIIPPKRRMAQLQPQLRDSKTGSHLVFQWDVFMQFSLELLQAKRVLRASNKVRSRDLLVSCSAQLGPLGRSTGCVHVAFS